MGTAVLAALGGAATALLLVALVAVLRRRNRTRADLEAMLDAALREADDLRARLEDLTGSSSAAPVARAAVREEVAAYLITDVADAGSRALEVPPDDPVQVPDRWVLSATLGRPLVKVAAFSHGMRRALAPETRNRIRFEMRRQVRAARKRRRREVREHLRQVRADERAAEARFTGAGA